MSGFSALLVPVFFVRPLQTSFFVRYCTLKSDLSSNQSLINRSLARIMHGRSCRLRGASVAASKWNRTAGLSAKRLSKKKATIAIAGCSCLPSFSAW